MLCIETHCGSEEMIRRIRRGGGDAIDRRCILAKQTSYSKGANNNIEALMLRDNLFFTSFVWYCATINMEYNIMYMVQDTVKERRPS
jgi:hypothetical protein